MFDLNPMFDDLAHQQIRERTAARPGPQPPTRHRPRPRQAWARRLHALADRLDA